MIEMDKLTLLVPFISKIQRRSLRRHEPFYDSRKRFTTTFMCLTIAIMLQTITCFNSLNVKYTEQNRSRQSVSIFQSMEPDAEIDRGLRRARDLLVKSKAKLAAKDVNNQGCDSSIPFFATLQCKKSTVSKDGVVKFRDELTGLITTNGEKMAEISEQEEWEMRSLLDVFDNFDAENGSAPSSSSHQLASRDIAASVFNLRRQLQTSDYERIFDKRNFLIGEDN